MHPQAAADLVGWARSTATPAAVVAALERDDGALAVGGADALIRHAAFTARLARSAISATAVVAALLALTLWGALAAAFFGGAHLAFGAVVAKATATVRDARHGAHRVAGHRRALAGAGLTGGEGSRIAISATAATTVITAHQSGAVRRANTFVFHHREKRAAAGFSVWASSAATATTVVAALFGDQTVD